MGLGTSLHNKGRISGLWFMGAARGVLIFLSAA